MSRLRRLRLWALERLFWRPFSEIPPLLFAAAAVAWLWRRLLWRTTFVAVTGSVGKTTAKEATATLLAARFPTVRSLGNRNNSLGVVVNLLRVRPWHRFAVFELAGASSGRLRRAAWLVRPDAGVVLNVLRTHTAAFPDLEAHAAEKQRLLDALRPGGLAVLNADDPRVAPMRVPPGVRVRTFGTAAACDVRGDEASSRWPERLALRVHVGGESARLATQLVGTHWLPSVLAAVATADACGVPLAEIAAAAPGIVPFPARLDPRTLPGGAVVLRDDYNASIDTFEPACRALADARGVRRIFVVQDVSDAGIKRRHRLARLAAAAARSADLALFVGESAEHGRRRAVAEGMRPEAAHAFSTQRAAAEFLRRELRAGDLALIKSRTTDHAARLYWAQLGELDCWKPHCRKTTLCDGCWELGLQPRAAAD